MDNFGFLKVAAAVPHVRVADCDYNTERMAAMAEEAARRGVEIVAFPELGVTAYTCGDLLLQQTLLDAADEALERLVRATRKLPLTLIAGAPLRHGSTLYNCAVVFTQGKVLGVVPKTYIPDYGEFYENRWFASGAGISDEHIAVAGQQADFGADLTFEVNGAEFGIEICEDLWTAAPPSSQLALNGAKVIFNLSASPESVGKHAYLRQLVAQQSGRAIAAYVYCSAGFGESTTDLVFAGNAVIAENGCILREAARFSPDEQLVVADVDIERLEFERRRNTSFRANEGATENTVIEMEIPEGLRGVALDRDIDPMPFVPKDEADRSERCEEIFRIQSHGLAQRMVHTRSEKAVVGISGGLDSTLALLVTARTFDFLHLDRAGIIGITMPGFGTTDRTYNNALELMRGLGVTIREIPIRDACTQHFQDIGLDPGSRGAAYENAQARERTQILMDVANMEGGHRHGRPVGTGAGLGDLQRRPDVDVRRQRLGSQDAGAPPREVGRRDGTGRRDARHAARHHRHARQPRTAPGRRRGPDRPEDRGPRGALRTPRLLPLQLPPRGLRSGENPAAGRTGLRRELRPRHDSSVAHGLRPPFLHPAIQTFGHARRTESRLGDALAPRRLAHALRRLGSGMAARTRHVIT